MKILAERRLGIIDTKDEGDLLEGPILEPKEERWECSDDIAQSLIECLGCNYLCNPMSKELVWQIPLTECSVLTLAYFNEECAVDIMICDHSARYVDEVHATGPDLGECLDEQIDCLISNMETYNIDSNIIECVEKILCS